MFRNTNFVIAAGSVYFLTYLILIFFNLWINTALAMFFLSPLIILWMAYTIIRYGKYTGKELRPDEEWAYGDSEKEELGIF